MLYIIKVIRGVDFLFLRWTRERVSGSGVWYSDFKILTVPTPPPADRPPPPRSKEGYLSCCTYWSKPAGLNVSINSKIAENYGIELRTSHAMNLRTFQTPTTRAYSSVKSVKLTSFFRLKNHVKTAKTIDLESVRVFFFVWKMWKMRKIHPA